MNSDGFSSASLEPTSAPGRLARGLPAWLASLLALALGVAVTFTVGSEQQRRARALREQQLADLVENSNVALSQRLQACELLVRSVQTLFLTSQQVEPHEFSAIYANLRPRERFPGLLAMAFAERQSVDGQERWVTRYVEPQAGNQSVIGLDLTRQPGNLAAALLARDLDEVVLSEPFRLVQDAERRNAREGQVMRLAAFSPGPPPRTVAERQARTIGSLGVSFRMADVIESALSSEARRRMHVRVEDVSGGASQLIFDSRPDTPWPIERARYERLLAFGGRTWRIAMQPMEPMASAFDWRTSVLLPGLLASVLLALLVWSVSTTRQRALELGRAMSRRYRDSEARFRAVNELLPALVLLADAHGAIRYANQASRTRLGEGVIDLELGALFEDPMLRARLEAPESAGCDNIEALLRTANGDTFWASVSIARVELDGQNQLLMVASDISQQRQLTELLTYQASHDALTELYNRREFERRIEQGLAGLEKGGAPFALLYVDLDQFKLINDTSGHTAGDQLLIQLSNLMREQLRGGDVLARLGGDEFGVLAHNVTDLAGAKLVAERLRQHIDGYVFSWDQGTYSITASIGAVMLDRADVSLKELFAQADTACFIAKEAGRNRVHFYSDADDATTRRRNEMEWANRLRWAVEGQRLQLYFQEVWPLALDLEGGPRVELLLRFRDETNRIVAPGAFLPAAERYGLMPMIDRWVIETALANFDRLHPAGRALQMATINLSGASIEEEGLADLILELIERYQVNPARICFEVTETVAVRNLAEVSRFIERLRRVGIRFALDDFGAGMSSFGYLKNLPVDLIKIDGSFIQDLLSDPMSHAIVRAVTDIGHQRHMGVVAEWVDSREITEALRGLRVDYAQGFGLHRPEPAAFLRSR